MKNTDPYDQNAGSWTGTDPFSTGPSGHETDPFEPDIPNQWVNKGHELVKKGSYKDAINCYNEALKLNPNLPRAWCSKGYALIKLKKYKESHACLDEALRINPRHVSCWTIKGWAFKLPE